MYTKRSVSSSSMRCDVSVQVSLATSKQPRLGLTRTFARLPRQVVAVALEVRTTLGERHFTVRHTVVAQTCAPLAPTVCNKVKLSKSKEGYSSLQASPLWELRCHMGSHSVTCHPAEVIFPPLPQAKLVLNLATPGDARLG